MEKDKVDYCYCCKREKEGIIVDGKFVCNDCNFLKKDKNAKVS